MTGRKGSDILTKITRFVRLILLVPFLLLQLVASGTMAEAGPDGLRMVLCTSDGVVTVIMAADGTVHPVPSDTHDQSQHDPCPWSLTIGQAALISVLPDPAVTLISADLVVSALAALGVQSSRHIRPQTRAPPRAV